LGLVGTVTNGTITTPTVSVDDVDAKICGIVQVQPGTGGCAADTTITVPADGQAFAPLKATVAVVPGQPISVPFTVVPHPLTASLGCGSSADGLVFSVSATVSGSTGLFGVACTIGPIALSIQGAAGQPGFNPPTTSLSDVTGRFTADFGIPAVSPDATCPSSVAANLDPIAQLPTTPDAAHLVLPIVTSIYQPG
jgi:hypothetical protein